jgi:methyl-accepting chemotaxis protein
MSTMQRDTIAGQLAFADAYHAMLVRSLARAATANETIGARLDEESVHQRSATFLTLARSELLDSDTIGGDAQQFLAAGNDAIRQQYAFASDALQVLDGLIEARVAKLRATLLHQLWIAAVCIAIALYMLVAFYRVTQGGVQEIARHLDEMAKGNLTLQPRPWGTDEAARLMLTLAKTFESLRGIVHEVRRGANEIESASSEIASGSMDLSDRSQEAAAHLQRTSATMEQFSGNVHQTSDLAAKAADIVAQNAQTAERSGQIVDEVVRTMSDITGASARIGEIIGVIDEIAFQTNILALNAAVEAARAGEHGRGFAVVASEVRSLAHRTATAAREVKALIESSIAQVDGGARVVAVAGTTMHEMVDSARRIKDLMDEISRSAQRQTSELEEVRSSIDHVDSTTQHNASLFEQTAAATAVLKDNSRRLSEEVSYFRLA